MGKKGRRNTVKTGDKAVSKKHVEALATRKTTEDPIYDDVDRFHNEKDFVAFDASNEDNHDEVEAVMDLAAGGDESSSDSSDEIEDSSDYEDDEEQKEPPQRADLEIPSSDNDDILEDDDDEEEEVNVRDWGQNKSVYYSGEAAENEDDVFDEEEAAIEVQRERFSKMAEEDFMLSDDDEGENIDNKPKAVASVSSKASKRERLKHLDKEHTELSPLLNHFSQLAKDLQATTMVAVKAIFEGEKGTAQVSPSTVSGASVIGLGRRILPLDV